MRLGTLVAMAFKVQRDLVRINVVHKVVSWIYMLIT